jgi:hypothetical protein
VSSLFFKLIICVLSLPIFCFSKKLPDLGGVLDFSRPHVIKNQLQVLTNPKSGTNLLIYSILKITKRPIRGRCEIWHYKNNPTFFAPENMMNYPLDFSKPTFYWGHEFDYLKPLNHSRNQLIFILRNHKENLSSQLIRYHKHQSRDLSEGELCDVLLEEVINEGHLFKDYIARLQVFDNWHPSYRCLVSFEDLAHYPEVFVPQVMSFIGDDSDYEYFINHYDDFKGELMERYSKKGNRTGAGTDLRFFSKKIPLEILQAVDRYIEENYPVLWDRYLERFQEASL